MEIDDELDRILSKELEEIKGKHMKFASVLTKFGPRSVMKFSGKRTQFYTASPRVNASEFAKIEARILRNAGWKYEVY